MRAMRAASLVALAALMGTGCTAVQGTRDFTTSAPWNSYERIVVRTTNGSVRLTCGGSSQLRLEARKHINAANVADAERYLDQIEVVAQPDEHDQATFRVEVRIPEAIRHLSPGVSLSIEVPVPCAADIATSNGSIRVAKVKEPAVLVTENGRIEARDVAGELAARTSNGPIQAERVQGSLQAETSNARIVARDIAGELAARTSNGSIQAERVEGACRLRSSNGSIRVLAARGNVQAETTNGSIHLEADPPEGAQISLNTSNASIAAVLPKQLRGAVKLDTSNGYARANWLNVPVEIQRQDRHHLHAVLNGGGPAEFAATTSSGSITVDLR